MRGRDPCPIDPLRIEHIHLAALRPDPRNPRSHSKRQVRQIAQSIREFGFVNPILIDEADRVIAGTAG